MNEQFQKCKVYGETETTIIFRKLKENLLKEKPRCLSTSQKSAPVFFILAQWMDSMSPYLPSTPILIIS